MLRSLLLLSKIGNREFRQTRPVDVATVAESILAGFGERIAMRKLSVEEHLNPVTLNMDEGLAEVLFTNLIKNAVVHSESGSVVKIDLTSNPSGSAIRLHPWMRTRLSCCSATSTKRAKKANTSVWD